MWKAGASGLRELLGNDVNAPATVFPPTKTPAIPAANVGLAPISELSATADRNTPVLYEVDKMLSCPLLHQLATPSPNEVVFFATVGSLIFPPVNFSTASRSASIVLHHDFLEVQTNLSPKLVV